jgi:hypothetical protein
MVVCMRTVSMIVLISAVIVIEQFLNVALKPCLPVDNWPLLFEAHAHTRVSNTDSPSRKRKPSMESESLEGGASTRHLHTLLSRQR